MMRNRFSVEKAEWSIDREENYKKECFKMTFTHKDKLIIENETVYLFSTNELIPILKPINRKSFWFETWTYLKNYYT
jgi:hypothetical protein